MKAVQSQRSQWSDRLRRSTRSICNCQFSIFNQSILNPQPFEGLGPNIAPVVGAVEPNLLDRRVSRSTGAVQRVRPRRYPQNTPAARYKPAVAALRPGVENLRLRQPRRFFQPAD